MTTYNLTPVCRRRASLLLLAAVFLLTGCTTPIDRWQTSMQVYTAGNNIVAAALDDGKIKVEEAKAYRDLSRVVRAAMDGWLITISPDGKSDDGSARAAAESALVEIRAWISRVLTKQ